MIDSLAKHMASYFGHAAVEVGAGLAISVEVPGAYCLQAFMSGPRDLEVTFLWVHPDLRGDGIATCLMVALTRWADRNGVHLHLWTKPFRKPIDRSPYALAAWYASQFGFRPLDERRRPDEYHRVRMARP